MPIEIAGITLSKIHKIATLEVADFAGHRIPGLEGTVVQNLGRESVVLEIEGIFYGESAQDDLESLRDVYKAKEPVDFLAEIVGQAYFSEVILQQFEVDQKAEYPGQFSFSLQVAEYVPPPEPISDFGPDFPSVDELIGLEALDFMDMMQLPDLLSLPDFGDPSAPLNSIIDNLSGSLDSVNGDAQELGGLFGDENGSLMNDLQGSMDQEALESQVGDQVSSLNSTNDEMTQVQSESEQGASEMTDLVSNSDLPVTDQSDTLNQGYSSISDEVPTDTSEITGDLENEMDQYFEDLGSNLSSGVGNSLGAFESMGSLVNFSFSGEEENTPQSKGLFSPSAAARSLLEEENQAIAALESIRSQFDFIPQPLTSVNFLEWLLELLQRFPRKLFPLNYLPVLDELRDKLETILLWEDIDGPELINHISQSTEKLGNAIQAIVLDDGPFQIVNKLNYASEELSTPEIIELFNNLKNRLESLGQKVNSEDLSNASDEILALGHDLESFQELVSNLTENFIDNNHIENLNKDLLYFKSEMHTRMLRILAKINPPEDLEVINLLIGPVNNMLDDLGLNDITDRLQGFLGSITDVVDKLDISAVKDSLNDVIGGAADGIDGLSNLLTQATVKLKLVIDKVEQTVDALPVEDIVNAVQNALDEFQETIEGGLNAIFGPVRDFLTEAFTTINDLLGQFNLSALIDELLVQVQKITDFLSNPDLLETIDKLHGTLDTVNAELGEFSFSPVTNKVVEGIEVVNKALGIAAKIPLTDSLKEDLGEAVSKIPKSLRPVADTINGALETAIDEGPKPVLEAIKDKPAELVALVEGFSPTNFVSENLFQPYNDLLTQMESYDLPTLLAPIQEALDELKAQLEEAANPKKLLLPLEGPFNDLLNLVQEIDPDKIIQPLQEKLSEGIQMITDNLPLDEANTAFDAVAMIIDKIQQGVDVAGAFRELVEDIMNRIGGLENAQQQVLDLGDVIMAKVDLLDDISPFTEKMGLVEQILDNTKAGPLFEIIDGPIQSLTQELTELNAPNRLADLINAFRDFPLSKLENDLGPSQEKDDLLAILQGFDPLDTAVAAPLNALGEWIEELDQARQQIPNDLSDWDEIFHGPNSPFTALRKSTMTAEELRSSLEEAIQRQLTEAIAPAFKILEYVQAFFTTALEEFTNLISNLENKMESLLSVSETLEELREAINGLVEQLEGLDITFISTEVKEVFDALVAKLEAIHPTVIGDMLETAFHDLLDLLNIIELLQIEELDNQYKQLLENLRLNNPEKLIKEKLEPEYAKIPEFLAHFDISEEICTFLEILESLRVELESELNRTADAYEEMIELIPSGVQGQIGISVSAEIST